MSAPQIRKILKEQYGVEVFRMYATQESATVTLLCDRQVMKAVIDQFGIKVRTRKMNSTQFRATVNVCPGPNFYRWVFGWDGMIKIEGPENIREQFTQMLKDELSGYLDDPEDSW